MNALFFLCLKGVNDKGWCWVDEAWIKPSWWVIFKEQDRIQSLDSTWVKLIAKEV